MNTPTRWVLRGLALGHFAWAGMLAAMSLWCVYTALAVIPHMSQGSIWSHIAGALFFMVPYALLPGALGLWMGRLGQRLWRADNDVARVLMVTHGLLLVPGILLFAIGYYATGAAARSAAAGGGLLSPVAAVPLIAGGIILALSLCSMAAAWGYLLRPHNE